MSVKNIEKNYNLLNNINKEFLITEADELKSLVNYSSLSNEPIHRWFRYREGYSIQLVKKFIRNLPKGSIILDPFCGCGTSLIASQELGFESYGFDINPLSVLISKVKTQEYSEKDIKQLEKITKNIKKISQSAPADESPAFNIVDKIFHPDILASILRLRRFIKSVDKEHIRDFLMVAWLSILESVSNVYKEGNGIKYRNRKRTSKGYITIPDDEWQSKFFPKNKFDFPKQKISEQLSLMIKDAASRNKKLPKAHVFQASAEMVSEYLHENSIKHIIFSPPYCNCFNYFKIFKVELWMGEFVKSYKELGALSKNAVRSHVETKMERDYDEPIHDVNEYVKLIDTDKLWDKRIPKAVQGYFIDMKRILGNLYKVLKPGGKCIIVVGNSAYSGILIPTDSLLAKISNGIGFHVEEISVARHLTTSSQQKKKLEDRKNYLRESLVILKKSDQRFEEKKLLYVSELPIDVNVAKKEVFAIKNNGLCNLTHKFHRFPGKFIPHIPRWAITKYLSGKKYNVVFDPFCGSGTTLVESLLLGQNVYGIDVDPIARLVSQVKTTPISKAELKDCIDNVKKEIINRKDGQFKPTIPTLEHWFNKQAIKDLSVIRDVIELYKDVPSLYDFLVVCFLSVIRRASNADNQTQKTYVSHTYKKTPEASKLLFEEALVNYSKRLIDFGNVLIDDISSFLLTYNDSRKFSNAWNADQLPKVDLAITSPPYIKSVDYVYNQMAELFWIGDLFGMETQSKQNEYKKKYIGSEKVFKNEYAEFHETGVSSVDNLSARIYKKNKKHAYIVYKYFQDMKQHFKEMQNVLKPNSHYIMVVGDCLVSDEVILVHELIQDCASKVGFDIINIFGYEIRNRHMRFPRKGRGGIVKYDWIIDFQYKELKGFYFF